MKSCGSNGCRLRRCLRPPVPGPRRGRARGGGGADARGSAPGRPTPRRPLPSASRPGPARLLSGNERLGVAAPRSRGTSNRRRPAMAVSRWVSLLRSGGKAARARRRLLSAPPLLKRSGCRCHRARAPSASQASAFPSPSAGVRARGTLSKSRSKRSFCVCGVDPCLHRVSLV